MQPSTHRRSALRITAVEAANLVKSGDWVDYGALLAQPDAFDRALAARKLELRDVKIRACLSTRTRAVLEADPQREHFQWYNWHFGGYDRKKHDAGLCHYIPCNLGEIPDYYRRFIEPPDIVVLKTCEVDANGFFNLSVSNLWHRADHLARENRRCGNQRRSTVRVRRRERPSHQRGRLCDRGRFRTPAGIAQSVARATRSRRRTADSRGDRRRCVRAGRHRCNAECRLFTAARERCTQSRCSY